MVKLLIAATLWTPWTPDGSHKPPFAVGQYWEICESDKVVITDRRTGVVLDRYVTPWRCRLSFRPRRGINKLSR